MRTLGRSLEVLGLILPPLAMIFQLAERISLGQMLIMLVSAICLFGIGRIVEGYGGKAEGRRQKEE
ncbi:MAG: hypothetical protein WD278_12035 [Pirellulales bacterium]